MELELSADVSNLISLYSSDQDRLESFENAATLQHLLLSDSYSSQPTRESLLHLNEQKNLKDELLTNFQDPNFLVYQQIDEALNSIHSDPSRTVLKPCCEQRPHQNHQNQNHQQQLSLKPCFEFKNMEQQNALKSAVLERIRKAIEGTKEHNQKESVAAILCEVCWCTLYRFQPNTPRHLQHIQTWTVLWKKPQECHTPQNVYRIACRACSLLWGFCNNDVTMMEAARDTYFRRQARSLVPQNHRFRPKYMRSILAQHNIYCAKRELTSIAYLKSVWQMQNGLVTYAIDHDDDAEQDVKDTYEWMQLRPFQSQPVRQQNSAFSSSPLSSSSQQMFKTQQLKRRNNSNQRWLNASTLSSISESPGHDQDHFYDSDNEDEDDDDDDVRIDTNDDSHPEDAADIKMDHHQVLAQQDLTQNKYRDVKTVRLEDAQRDRKRVPCTMEELQNIPFEQRRLWPRYYWSRPKQYLCFWIPLNWQRKGTHFTAMTLARNSSDSSTTSYTLTTTFFDLLERRFGRTQLLQWARKVCFVVYPNCNPIFKKLFPSLRFNVVKPNDEATLLSQQQHQQEQQSLNLSQVAREIELKDEELQMGVDRLREYRMILDKLDEIKEQTKPIKQKMYQIKESMEPLFDQMEKIDSALEPYLKILANSVEGELFLKYCGLQLKQRCHGSSVPGFDDLNVSGRAKILKSLLISERIVSQPTSQQESEALNRLCLDIAQSIDDPDQVDPFCEPHIQHKFLLLRNQDNRPGNNQQSSNSQSKEQMNALKARRELERMNESKRFTYYTN